LKNIIPYEQIFVKRGGENFEEKKGKGKRNFEFADDDGKTIKKHIRKKRRLDKFYG